MTLTAGIAALPAAELIEVLSAVAGFDSFNPDNDPYGEHDLATLTAAGHQILFKIDAYDSDLQMASPDPTDPAVTQSALTIMRLDEY